MTNKPDQTRLIAQSERTSELADIELSDDVMRAVPVCPKNGCNEYKVRFKTGEDRPALIGITCAVCGFDILEHYRAVKRP